MNEEVKENIFTVLSDDYTQEQWCEMYVKVVEQYQKLQEENEELRKFRYTIRKDETKMPLIITRTYKKEYENYKEKIDKVIEHIKQHQLIYSSQYEELSAFDNHLLDILSGD